MQQPNPQDDPIVEVLRLAFRRGLAIQQAKQTADTTPLNTNAHGEGRLCKDGENGNSRKRACKGNQDAGTNP